MSILRKKSHHAKIKPMNTLILQKNADELGSFIKKANRKLLELEVLQAELEIKNGKGKTYSSAANFIKHIKSKLS
jgi:uncharacterized protein YqgV (UPF0045/DUF77 family)